VIRTGRIYTEKDDPEGHGLRCMDCDVVIKYGDEIAERLSGMIEDIPCVEIICGECGRATGDQSQEGETR
jgi:RNase P subunit RPR2